MGLESVEFKVARKRHKSNVAQIRLRGNRGKRINRSLITAVDYQLIMNMFNI